MDERKIILGVDGGGQRIDGRRHPLVGGADIRILGAVLKTFAVNDEMAFPIKLSKIDSLLDIVDQPLPSAEISETRRCRR